MPQRLRPSADQCETLELRQRSLIKETAELSLNAILFRYTIRALHKLAILHYAPILTFTHNKDNDVCRYCLHLYEYKRRGIRLIVTEHSRRNTRVNKRHSQKMIEHRPITWPDRATSIEMFTLPQL